MDGCEDSSTCQMDGCEDRWMAVETVLQADVCVYNYLNIIQAFIFPDVRDILIKYYASKSSQVDGCGCILTMKVIFRLDG